MPSKHETLELPKHFASQNATRNRHQTTPTHGRLRVVSVVIYTLFLGIVARLFYWQVIHGSVLQAQAENQYTRTFALQAQRGKILTSDGYVLVGNAPMYRLFAQPYVMTDDPAAVSRQLAPLLIDPPEEKVTIATDAAEVSTPSAKTPAQILAEQEQQVKEIEENVTKKLSDKNTKWVALKQRVDETAKQKIEEMKIHGLGFEKYFVRDYPEASMAAQVVGFVGKDADGNDQGYFGLEGSLDRELRGYANQKTFWKDALGFHLLFENDDEVDQFDGRNVTLTFRRDVQHVVEDMLKKGIERYGASAGEVIVMEPKTGKILAMASYPNYDPRKFYLFPPEYYKNPSVSSSYEPGSTFKVLTVAAGVDAGVITEDTQCTNCDSAREIAQYTIKTWNNEYHPNIAIKDALAKSDNVAMIFVAELLGKEKFVDYVKKFGIGETTDIELQEESALPLRKDWKPIDLATSSFGQGIATTGMQMVRAVGAIANGGVMMRPTIVEKVIDPAKNTEVEVQPVVEREVISPESAQKVTAMMVYAAASGEAKWTRSLTHTVAGKTGTAQIPIDGHYDETKTMASFIGFAPPENPKFVMLVKLRETQSSQWASETAAPLWYQIADKLYLLLNIPPDK